jgi:hypothetical protein
VEPKHALSVQAAAVGLHRLGFRGKLFKEAVALGRRYSRNQMPQDYQGGTCPIKGSLTARAFPALTGEPTKGRRSAGG